MATNATEEIRSALTPGGELLVNVGKAFGAIHFF